MYLVYIWFIFGLQVTKMAFFIKKNQKMPESCQTEIYLEQT
jgi:hypothetical protein